MLRFDWSAFVTPELVVRLAAAVEVPEDTVAHLHATLAGILRHVGGLPFVPTEPTPEARAARAWALLSEAVMHTLAQTGVTHARDGVAAGEADPAFSRCVRAIDSVDANRATLQELAALPGMTPSIAQAVLAERASNGRFRTLKEFEKRVDSIGPKHALAIAGALTFGDEPRWPSLHIDRRGDAAANLRTLMTLQCAADRASALAQALDQVLTCVATTPHPACDTIRQAEPPAEPLPVHDAGWVGELWGSDYWPALPGLMDSAVTSIDVCMFHIAAPNAHHPTFAPLQALVRAHQRGAAVRVLVDRDNKNDPYHSTVINSDAKRFLLDAGVPCRSDRGNKLLHSKYLVIDRSLVVLGSHNWSAGSYFDFDDLSLAVSSPELATELGHRFDGLWELGY